MFFLRNLISPNKTPFVHIGQFSSEADFKRSLKHMGHKHRESKGRSCDLDAGMYVQRWGQPRKLRASLGPFTYSTAAITQAPFVFLQTKHTEWKRQLHLSDPAEKAKTREVLIPAYFKVSGFISHFFKKKF